MIELVQANWPLFIIAIVVGLLVAWWIFVALRRTKVETDASDVLDEGKGPASRNQALINAPPAAASAVVPPTPKPEFAPATAKMAEPAQQAAAKPVAAPADHADDLTRIKGVGPKLKSLLNDLGVMAFAQIADWNDADIDRIDAQLGRFEGRIRRDSWTDQARLLAAGDTAGYEEKFGKL